MKKRLAAMTAAVLAWGGFLTILGLQFSGALDDFQWGGVRQGFLGLAIVASIAWMQVTFAVIPRTAFRAGVEVGERRRRRQEQTRELIMFPAERVPAARNGHRL